MTLDKLPIEIPEVECLAQGNQEWNEYLEALGIASQQAIRLVTEAALLGSAIEHGVSPELIVLSDGAKQFDILVHALCWVHMERSLRRLNGVTAQQRQEIEQVQETLLKIRNTGYQEYVNRLKIEGQSGKRINR